MSRYPIVLIPAEIERIKTDLPPLPPSRVGYPQRPEEPKQPAAPGAKPEPIGARALAITAGVGIFIVLVLYSIWTFLGIVSFLFLLALLAILVWYDKDVPRLQDEYRQKYELYEQQQLRYQKEMEAMPTRTKQYELELERYDEELRRLKAEHHSPEKIAQFRRGQLLQYLQAVSYDGHGSNAREGGKEYMLEAPLNSHFPRKIHRRLTINSDYNPPYDKYTPDFAYIDKETGLHIDIEVDEPYTYENGQAIPTHYLGSRRDERRNGKFLRRRWVVIRFSERQICDNPLGCCKVVGETIAGITDNAITLTRMEGYPDLQPERQWTYGEAVTRAMDKERDSY